MTTLCIDRIMSVNFEPPSIAITIHRGRVGVQPLLISGLHLVFNLHALPRQFRAIRSTDRFAPPNSQLPPPIRAVELRRLPTALMC